jgi:glutamate-1-semialdehyde 2,1-aminomutase
VPSDWEVLNSDSELFARELNSFVPDRIFDSHAHLYHRDHFGAEAPALVKSGPACAGILTFREQMNRIHPGRACDGLFFGYPHAANDMAAANRFVADEVAREAGCRAQMLIRPEMPAEFVYETVRSYGFSGLKCYHIYATERPTFDATIPSYLPEEHVRVAHELKLSITLHMVRARALADASNQYWIRHYSAQYPDVRLILAHAARGFNPHHTVEGIDALRGLENVWFDTSAVTDSGAFEAILRTFGPTRLLYGADFPVSHLRARCVALGDSFLWISAENTRFDAAYANVQPIPVALESLRTLRLACWNLKDRDVEAIFYRNAAELYGL